MRVQTDHPEILAKRMFWLAYQASSPLGMGFLQARSNVTEEDVWRNVNISGDYAYHNDQPGKPYGDYVFGRMMKVGCEVGVDYVQCRDGEAAWDYQSWAGTYPMFEALLQAAVASLEAEKTRTT